MRRCEAGGKRIDRAAAEHLIFCSGALMNRLIPEIDKLTSYARGETITREDIDAVIQRLPEADVFHMTDCLSRREFDAAAATMGELLQMREHPIMLLALIGQQMRRLYAARLAIDRTMWPRSVTSNLILSSTSSCPVPAGSHCRSSRGQWSCVRNMTIG